MFVAGTADWPATWTFPWLSGQDFALWSSVCGACHGDRHCRWVPGGRLKCDLGVHCRLAQTLTTWKLTYFHLCPQDTLSVATAVTPACLPPPRKPVLGLPAWLPALPYGWLRLRQAKRVESLVTLQGDCQNNGDSGVMALMVTMQADWAWAVCQAAF